MFYQWLSVAYAIPFCAALWLNRKEFRMLLLSCVVAAGIFVPIPPASTASLWYFQCMLVELLVVLAAVRLNTTASVPVIMFAILLGMMHLTGIVVGPQPGVGPYRIIIPILEMSQLVVCILMAAPTLNKIAAAAGLRR